MQTALIHAYAMCTKSAHYSLKVFDSIAQKNNVCVGAILKVLLECNQGAMALDLYDEYLG
eukprot:CAMPEP_0202717758 /NCGR_PEP_ID=MMETSP1385-20130828/114824_1 /ASSEMBLY_ACC=CAM_ASM_000861 /TAXON_ID=933848 /ORGANISM="Elphidium margaritaceum" /LENGTH=59 /DNA_ID=CAMNT_0049380139 /DNA_START=1 /DNA_END=176 /DNA_ORIENTATION=+